MRFSKVFFSVSILIFLTSVNLFGNDEPEIELIAEEAPETIWDMTIGDTDVDLYLAGSWKMGIAAGLSVQSGPSGVIFPAAFPGLTKFNFYQEPDLTISLWLMNKFYLETSFLEGFDKNTYTVGYRGFEGDVIQSVRIGNSDIKIEEYKGISVPSPKYNTPGICGSFQTNISTHDILFRYDPTSEHKKVFLGDYEITEEIIQTTSFNRGISFVLPEENLDFIEVYIADKSGIYSASDNKTYKKATDNEAQYSLTDGTVFLSDKSETDVLVYYEKSGTAVGNTLISDFIVPLINGEPDPDGTGLPFSWSSSDTWYSALGNYEDSCSVVVNSRKALKVYNPQKTGPFELFNQYNISSQLPSDLWRTSVFLADNSLTETEDCSKRRESWL